MGKDIAPLPDEALRSNIEAWEKLRTTRDAYDHAQATSDDGELVMRLMREWDTADDEWEAQSQDLNHGLAAVSQALLDERAKVQAALERIDALERKAQS